MNGVQHAATATRGPAPQDMCAVAINMAARMAYAAHRQWAQETGAEDAPAWEDLPSDQRANMVGFVLTLAAYPNLTADDMHDMAVEKTGDAMPPATQVALPLCPPSYKVSMALNVGVARAVIDNLVSARDMRDYLQALDNGTDEFMQGH